MIYLAIVSWTADNRVAKYQDYPTEAKATAHVARVMGRFPGAFVAADLGGGFSDWLVNPVGKTLSLSPPPKPPFVPVPLTAEELADHLITKNTITRGEIDAIKAAR